MLVAIADCRRLSGALSGFARTHGCAACGGLDTGMALLGQYVQGIQGGGMVSMVRRALFVPFESGQVLAQRSQVTSSCCLLVLLLQDGLETLFTVLFAGLIS